MVGRSKIFIFERMYANSWPTMWYLRMIGLFPLVVTRTKLGLVMKWSPWFATYSYVYGAFIIVFAIYGQVIDLFADKGKSIFVRSIIDIFPRLFSLTGYCAVAFCGIFIMPNKLNQFFDFIRHLKQVDTVIGLKYPKYDKYLSVLMVLSLFVIDNLLIALDTYMAYQVVGSKIGVLGILKRSGGMDFVAQMTYAVEFTNFYLVRSLERRFVRLNDLIKRHYTMTKNMRQANLIQTRAAKTNVCDSAIVELRKVYLQLMDAQNILNDFLGLSSLIAIVSVSLTLVANPYFLIMILRGKRGGIPELIDRVSNFAMQINRVVLLTEPWYVCTLRVETTKADVCKLLTLNSDRGYRQQVHTFCKVLGLRQVNISPLGLFNLNRLLISTMIGNITTFLVVLLQAHG